MNSPPENTPPPNPAQLHHIGFVVRSIQDSGNSFAQALGAVWDGNIVFDPIQKVDVTFLDRSGSKDPLIELVEPRGADSPVSRFLERGGGLHHLCYEVENLQSHLAFCKSMGTLIIHAPAPAVAFGGRRIAWGVTKTRLLLEFLERWQTPCPVVAPGA